MVRFWWMACVILPLNLRAILLNSVMLSLGLGLKTEFFGLGIGLELCGLSK